MSLSLREELRVVVSPDQVLLVSIGHAFTRHGLTCRVLQKKIVPCIEASGADAPWDRALKTLEMELPGMTDRAAFATVILSNHFMRYALVPWNGSLKNEREEGVVARHCFRQLYGAAAESWELRLSPDRAGAPQLASAVDSRLMEALRGLFADMGIKLRSIQPSLMVAYNSCRERLEKCSGWFVLFETGSLCLALLRQGRWGSIRTLRVGGEWRDTLSLLLEREAYLIDENAATDEVLLWAPELEKSALPASARWKINALQPVIGPGLLQDYDRRFAVAMSG